MSPHLKVGRLVAATLLSALALILTACGDDEPDTGDDQSGGAFQASDVIGKTFVSTDVEGHDLVEGSTIQLAFTDEALAVSAGCNTMTAAWEAEDEVIAWTGPAAATMMACSDELEAQDRWLDELFTGGMNVVSGDADLTLSFEDVTISLDEGSAE